MQELNFHLPNLTDKLHIDQLNKAFMPYADTAFGTLMTWWNLYGDIEFADLNGNMVIKSSYPQMGEAPTLSIIGAYKVRESLDTLYLWLEKKGLEKKLYFVPEYIVAALNKKERTGLIIEDDPDIAEYILSVKEQVDLAGRAFTHLRYKKNLFTANYGTRISSDEADLTNPHKRKLLFEYIQSWKSKTSNDIDKSEIEIIDKSLSQYVEIGLHAFTLNIDDTLVAVALFKIMPHGHININHIKVDYTYKHVFTFTIYKLAEYLASNYKSIYMNIEQDLGIIGLRHFKQQQRPIMMNKKYTITLGQ